MLSLTFSQPLVLLLLPLVLGWVAWLWLSDQGNLSLVRHRMALALRLVIMTALVLVLAGATWQQPERRQATVFVADLSDSVAGLRERETSFIDQALKARGHDDEAAIVAVGADALVEQPVAALNGFSGFQSLVDRTATNLEAGLNLAGALFPVGYRKRVVVLTDGQQNLGDAISAARLLRDEGVRVDVVPLAPAQGAEVLVSGVDAPATLHRNENVPVTVHVHSTVAQPVTLDVSDAADGNRLLARKHVRINAGDTPVAITLPPLGQGYHRLHVAVTPDNAVDDSVSGNNVGDAVTRVLGAPRVLLAEGLPGEGRIVAASLRAKGMRVSTVEGTALQASTAYFTPYDAVVMVDVPAIEMDPGLLDPQHSPLRSYVDGGGGLVVLGGPNSYGVGGYTDTALDTILPVSMKLPQRKDTPSVAVALIIESLESDTNINISKAAGEGVIKLLTPLDQVEVNGGDGAVSGPGGWAVPLQHVTNKQRINAAIEAMEPDDPFSYAPALQSAFTTLSHSGAKIKHIILLGDGDAEDSAYQALVTRIRKAGVTVSTVATGAGGFGPTDYATMQNIARWGGGRYYQSDNVNAIPQIFLKETKQIARTGLVEEHFTPDLYNNSAIVNGIPAFPLDGYVATTPKPSAEQVLMHTTKHGNDPILAQWQYGAGRAVAWTSDAQGEWTRNVVGQAAINGKLWANMVTWVLPPPSSPNLALVTGLTGGHAHLTVTTSGLPLDAAVTAHVDGPGHATTLRLQPTAPGQYEGDVPATATGAYLVTVSARAAHHAPAVLRSGLVVPYAPEYRATGLNRPIIAGLTAAASGVTLRDPAASFADNLSPVYAPRPLTTWLLLLALLLLPFDVATRRLLIGWAEVRDGLAALLARRRLQPAMAGTATAPLGALRTRRATRQERVAAALSAKPDAPAGSATAPVPNGNATTQKVEPARQSTVTVTGATGQAAPAGRTARVVTPVQPPAPERGAAPSATGAAPSAAAPSAEASSTSSHLLEAKRRRRRS